MKNNKKSGISLIVLVITIIVIIILAGAIILSLFTNNSISQATKATYLSDVKNFQTELNLYEAKQFSDKLGAYDPKLLQADESSVTYNGIIDTSKSIYDLIALLNKSGKYAGQFQVIDGKLVFQGSDVNKQNWVREIDVEVVMAGEPRITIIAPTETVVSSGTDIVYTLKFTSNAALTTIDLTNKVEVLDNNGVALVTQPVINVGTISGTPSEATRQVDITVKTDSLANGTYKLKIKSGAVTNVDNISNSIDVISLIGFDIDSTPPTNPVMSLNPSGWTNGNVEVSITYSDDSAVKEYSLDGTNWNTYTTPIEVSTNNTTIYARGKDAVGNGSGVATSTVTNIDRIIPTVAYGTNGGSGITASTTVTVSDVGGSGVNTSTLQYVWDTQNTTEPTSGWTTFTNGATLTKTGVTGTYYLWIKGSDATGNTVTTKSSAFLLSIEINQSFNYTGNYQTWTVPATGTYKLEVWGAQGGNGISGQVGGKGGYSKGNITLNAGQVVYIYVGAQGAVGTTATSTYTAGGWNGGGRGYNNGQGGSGGGGATDIRINGTALSNRIIVAGGGGGATHVHIGGFGGGANGGTPDTSYTYRGGGGTQTAGGTAGSTGAYTGSLGQGGDSTNDDGAGGGGGYYGGGGGSNDYGGGGGSGYIGTLSSSQTISGDQTMPSPSGSTQVGQTGNGKANITLVN